MKIRICWNWRNVIFWIFNISRFRGHTESIYRMLRLEYILRRHYFDNWPMKFQNHFLKYDKLPRNDQA